MGYKRRITLAGLLILLWIVACALIGCKNLDSDFIDHLQKIPTMQSEIQVGDIFTFSFDRAYVIDDCYLSGTGFAEAYNLNLSISEVSSGVSENIHRIVFVDKEGNFVYDFQYDINMINFATEGLIIYPDTQISLHPSLIDGVVTLQFESKDCYK